MSFSTLGPLLKVRAKNVRDNTKLDYFKTWSFTFLTEAQTVTITKEQIDLVNWQKVGGAWVIRLFTTEGKVYRFAGFQDWDRLQLSRSVHYILIDSIVKKILIL